MSDAMVEILAWQKKYQKSIERINSFEVPTSAPWFTRGRITLTSGLPVSMADASGVTEVYFSPIYGGFTELSIGLTQSILCTTVNGDATVTTTLSFAQLLAGMDVTGIGIAGGTTVLSITSETELELSANATADGTVNIIFTTNALSAYDVYVTSERQLRLIKWTNPTTRSTVLAFDKGIPYITGDVTNRYLGTVYCRVAGHCEDTKLERFCWSMYGRVVKVMTKSDATASWTYNAVAWRASNNNTANKVSFICGIVDNCFSSVFTCGVQNGSSRPIIGISLTGASPAQAAFSNVGSTGITVSVSYKDYPAAGLNSLAMNERCSAAATATFVGTYVAGVSTCHLFATIEC